MIVEGERE